LWELSTGRCLHTFEGHTSWVLSVSLSADGRFALSGSDDTTLKLWEVSTGRCLRTFEGHSNRVSSVSLSPDGGFALSGSYEGSLKVWFLDWDLEERLAADWDEGARPYLETFLTLHTPYAGKLPTDRSPTEEESTQALSRRGKPVWTEEALQQLLYTLGCAGYGWLKPEGVRRELEKMAAAWQGPPPLV
jgi:WD40 repeat protein